MKNNVMRLLLSLMAFLTMGNLLAENNYDNSLSIKSEGGDLYSVYLENQQSAGALEFTLVLPEELQIKKSTIEGRSEYVYRNPERLNNKQDFYCTAENDYDPRSFKCMVVSFNSKDTFIGTSGPIAYFQVVPSNKLQEGVDKVNITLQNIVICTPKGEKLNCNPSWNDEVTLNASVVAYFSQESCVINPGSKDVELSLAIRNSIEVRGLQMNMTLPKGFTLNPDSFEFTDRISNKAHVEVVGPNSENTYSLLVYDFSKDAIIPKVGQGDVFKFYVTAPDDNDFQDGDIVVSDVIASIKGIGNLDNSLEGVGGKMSVINGYVKYQDAQDEITALKTALETAKAEIAESCPDVKNDFTGENITSAIEDLEAAVTAAYEDLTLTPKYDEVMAPVETIKADITKLVEDAKAAQATESARQAANKAAYDASVAALDALQENLDNTVTIIDAEYADYKDADAIAAVQGMIDAEADAAADALAAVEEEGDYKFTVDSEGITKAIDDLLQAAKDAKKKAEDDAEAVRQVQNAEAYNADMEALNELYANYRKVVSDIQTYYPKYENVSAELAVRNNLDAEKDAIDKAYKAVEKEGTYKYDLDVEGLQASIDKLLADAKGASDAEAAEALRKENNEKAYNAIIAQVEALEAKYNAVVAEIKKDYADYEDVKAEDAVKAQIDAVRAAATAEAAKVADKGTFEYTFDYDALSASIDKLLADAKAAMAAADAEAADALRKENNQKAYNTVIDQVKALEEKYDAVVAEIKADYADYEDEEAEAAVKAQIDAVRAAADAALAAVEKEGEFKYTFDAVPIEAAIDQLLADAKAAKAKAEEDAAEALRKENNQKAYDAVIDQVKALEEKYNDVVAEIKEKYADFEDEKAEAAVKAQIDAVRAAADAALEAANAEKDAKFEYTFDAAPIEAAIDQLLADAKEASEAPTEETIRLENNLKAYQAVIAQIDALEAKLKEVIAKVKADYPDYENVEAEIAIQENLDEIRAAASLAYEAVVKEGNYEYSFDVEALSTEIDNLYDDAKALAESDADRIAKNKAAYDTVLDEIAALNAALDEAVELILAEYPQYNATAQVRNISAAITAMKNEADEAYAAVAKEGDFDYTVDSASIHAMISQMIDDAVAFVGVEAIEAEVVAGNAYIFTLDGKQHQRPVHGEVNVIVRKNGERSKIYVK